MAKNVMRGFNNPEAQNINRNFFDLSQRHIFSAKAGQIIPVCCVDTVPGDKFVLDMMSVARTMPLNSAAFTRLKLNFDWVFVPYRVLWSRFNEFIAQRNDPRSALYGTQSMDNPNMTPMYVPNISLSDMFQAMQGDSAPDMMGFSKAQNGQRLMDMLGYGDPRHSTSWDGSPKVNLWRFLAYQKACAQFYRDSVHDPLEDAFAFNVDDVQGTSVENSDIKSVRSYLELYPIFKLNYRPWKKDIVTGTMPTMQYGSVSAVPLSSELIGVSTIPHITTQDTVNWSYDSLYYSSKAFGAGVNPGSSSSSQIGSISAVNDGTNTRGNVVVDSIGSDSYDSYVQVRTGHSHPNGTATFASGSSLFDIIELRKAEAVQKWKERTLRAGYHTDKQFVAHYGVSADEDGRWVSDFIGSYDSYVNISEVITTANNNPTEGGTDMNNNVGDIAGKGVGLTEGNKLHFETNQFGVLMCLFSAVPEADYASYGLDANNTSIERFDYFTKEYENLGLEAVPVSIYNLFKDSDDKPSTQLPFGYGPRYWKYKTALDKVHGEFNYQADATRSGSLYDWATPRRDLTQVNDLPTLAAYYINPRILDSIFAVEANDQQSTDQLIINAYFEVKALRNMSVIGLPY